MVLDVKRSAVDIGTKLIFENMVSTSLQEQFTRQMTSKLAAVQSKQGLNSFKVICNNTNNSQSDIDANRMNAQIIMAPVGAVEYISLDFIICNSAVQFL
jgi:phage tail sheath protein FI